jgi:hypothetical protein
MVPRQCRERERRTDIEFFSNGDSTRDSPLEYKQQREGARPLITSLNFFCLSIVVVVVVVDAQAFP